MNNDSDYLADQPLSADPENMTNIQSETEELTFRKLISRLLNMFLHSRDMNTIEDALSIVLSYLKADRISLRIFNPNNPEDFFIYKAKREGITDIPESLIEVIKSRDHIYHDIIQQIVKIIRTGEEIVVNNINELPSEYLFAKEVASMNDTKSYLALPTYGKEQLNGYLFVDYVTDFYTWKASDIENLKVISDIFANAIEHERTEKEKETTALNTMKNEALLHMVFQKLPVGVELYDENGILTRINQADLDIFGIAKEDVVGINMYENPLITDETKAKLRKKEEISFETVYDFEVIAKNNYYNSKHKEGQKSLISTFIPLKDLYDNLFGYILLVYDNTEHYLQKKELEYNLTKLRMALDTGKALIWEYDIENDKLSFDETLSGDISSWIFMNVDNSDMFTSEGQLNGVHPEDTERFYTQAVMPMLSGEINQVTVTYRQYMNGKLEWLTSNFRSLPSANGPKPSKVFCYSMIVTEQHETELELIKIKESDRLKTIFMENLSHEIRTPLNAIVGFSNIMAENNQTKENETFKNLINENNDALLYIVENMLDLSKVDAGEMEYEFNHLDIVQVGQDIFNKYSSRAAEGVQINYTHDLTSPTIYSDEKRIRQVIAHLLDNAVKFTEQGRIDLSICQEENHLIVSVTDTGIGLTEEEKKQLYLPFYKGNTFQKGTGLGLHISQKLIKGLGGDVSLESEKGKGSKFWFTLPLPDRPK